MSPNEVSPERLADQVRQLETVRSMALALTSETDSDTLLCEIVRHAVALLDAKSGGIYAYQPERAELVIIADWGRPDDLLGHALPANEGMAGHLLRSGDDYLIVDDYNASPFRASSYAAGHFFGAVIEVPLRWRDTTIGVIYVDDVVGRQFTADDARLLRLLADHAAIAITNARLAEHDRQKLRRLERLSQISSQLMAGLEGAGLEQRLDMIVTYAAEILDAETSGIWLADGERIVLRASAGHRPEHAAIGRSLPIVSAEGGGLTSHIAASRRLFHAAGVELNTCFAVRGTASHTPAGRCHSVLSVPLFGQQPDGSRRYLGLIRADNKRGSDGRSGPTIAFSQEDSWILTLFADVAVNAIQAADLVAQLSRQKEQFERLIHSAPVGIVVNDAAGLITQVNQRAVSILGHPQEAILGRPVQSIYETPEEALAIGQELRNLGARGVAERRAHLRAADGARIPIQLAATLLTDSSDQPAYVGFFADLRDVRRREDLLYALDQASRHIRSTTERDRLMRQIVQLAVNLVGYDAGGLFLCHPHLGEMELQIVYELPSTLQGLRQQLTHGLAGHAYAKGALIAADGEPWQQAEPILGAVSLHSAVCLPLPDHAGGVAAILLVAAVKARPLTSLDHDVLSRFAAHAAIALRTSELVGREQRFYERRRFLHELGNFIQSQRSQRRVAHAILTGITAGYGLGFNRAALLLADQRRDSLRGIEGIGELTLAEAKRTWERHHQQGREEFRTYRRLLDSKIFDRELTALGERIRSLRLPLGGQDDLFSAIFASQSNGAQVVDADQLPRAFNEQFLPEGQVVVVPLMVGGTATGLIVADNKFTRYPISYDDCSALMAFADTAAGMLENLRLLEASERSVRELEGMHSLAELLAAGKGPQALLHNVAVSACKLLQARSAVIWRYNAVRQEFLPRYSEVYGIDEAVWRRLGQENPRPGGTVATVLRGRSPLAVEDVADAIRYPLIGEQTRRLCAAIDTRSFVAVALDLDAEDVGVIFINFPTPRTFSEEEHNSVQNFANYVALILKRARLQEQLLQTHEAARMISQVTVIDDLAKTLDLVAKGIMDALGSDAVTVYEYSEERGRLSYPPITYGLAFPERVIQLSDIPPDSVVYHILNREGMLVVDDTADRPEFRNLRFVRDERIISCLAIPLRSNQERVGVIFVNYRSRHSFSTDEQASIQLFADQAADAIRYAQIYQRESQRSLTLKEIHRAAQFVAGSPNLDMREFFQMLAQQAWELTSQPKRKISFANIRLYEDGHARFVAAYPREKYELAVAAIGESIDIHGGGVGGRIGVMGRAIIEGKSQLVNNVAADEDYIASDPTTRAELAVPIVAHDRVLGVINVEHAEENAFTPHDAQVLETLAAHAAIALLNAERFRELAQLGDYIDVRTMMKLVTMLGDCLMHGVARHISVARARLSVLSLALPAPLAPDAEQALEQLRGSLQQIAGDKLMKRLLSTEHDVRELRVNDVIGGYLERRWEHEQFNATELRLELQPGLDDRSVVEARRYWLEQALDILVDNAVEAMQRAGSPTKRVTVSTHLRGHHVEIEVRDTGPGIPEPYRPLLFEQRIPKEADQPGSGVGLILAKTFVRTFGGRITCSQTGPNGTCMVIRLSSRAPGHRKSYL